MLKTVVNQTELAREAGYSRFTVSKALAGHPSVPEPTRDHILKVARKLGYRPNAAAKAMKSGRFNTAALVYHGSKHDRSMFVFPQLLNGLNGELAHHDMHLTFSMFTDRHMAEGADGIQVLRELMVDGLLVNYDPKHSRKLREPIERLNVPAVWVNDNLAHDCARPDDVQAGRWATERLLGLGHRKVMLWHQPLREGGHYSTLDRVVGYRAAMRNTGLPAITVEHSVGGNAERQQQAHHLLASADRPTAIVTLGYDDAMSIMVAASQLRMRMPQDLSIVTIDVRHSYVHVPVETVRIPFSAVGEAAVQMLMKKIKHPARPLEPVVVPYKHIDEGPTVGPCGG